MKDKNNRWIVRLTCNVLFLVFVLVFAAVAQTQNHTSVTGRVSDQNDAAVRGAAVYLRARSGTQYFVTTDEHGGYVFDRIVPGDYLIEVQAKGFATLSASLSVARGQTLARDLQLMVEAVNEQV